MAAPRWAAEAAGRLGVPTDSLLLHSDLDALQLAPSPLPPAVGQMHQRALVGPFLLQILQIVDMTLTDEQRNRPEMTRDGTPDPQRIGRMLKLVLSDGTQRVKAMEYRRINGLSTLTPVGTKLLVNGVVVMRGTLLLTAESVFIIGGSTSVTMEGAATARVPVPGAAAPVRAPAPSALSSSITWRGGGQGGQATAAGAAEPSCDSGRGLRPIVDTAMSGPALERAQLGAGPRGTGMQEHRPPLPPPAPTGSAVVSVGSSVCNGDGAAALLNALPQSCRQAGSGARYRLDPLPSGEGSSAELGRAAGDVGTAQTMAAPPALPTEPKPPLQPTAKIDVDADLFGDDNFDPYADAVAARATSIDRAPIARGDPSQPPPQKEAAQPRNQAQDENLLPQVQGIPDVALEHGVAVKRDAGACAHDTPLPSTLMARRGQSQSLHHPKSKQRPHGEQPSDSSAPPASETPDALVLEASAPPPPIGDAQQLGAQPSRQDPRKCSNPSPSSDRAAEPAGLLHDLVPPNTHFANLRNGSLSLRDVVRLHTEGQLASIAADAVRVRARVTHVLKFSVSDSEFAVELNLKDEGGFEHPVAVSSALLSRMIGMAAAAWLAFFTAPDTHKQGKKIAKAAQARLLAVAGLLLIGDWGGQLALLELPQTG